MPKLRTPSPVVGLWRDGSNFTDPERDSLTSSALPESRGVLPTKPPVLYFIESDDLVKIGSTTRVVQAAVAAMNLPPGSKLVAVIDDGHYDREQTLREMFRARHVNGRWFQRCPEIDALIAAFAVA